MAPERLSTSGEPDHRADVYALACVLYGCLTAQRPFPGDAMELQIVGHLNTPPPRPSQANPRVPAAFDAVIATGTAKDPAKRYQSVLHLADAARAALRG
jgi:serine/threonine protein kinase